MKKIYSAFCFLLFGLNAFAQLWADTTIVVDSCYSGADFNSDVIIHDVKPANCTGSKSGKIKFEVQGTDSFGDFQFYKWDGTSPNTEPTNYIHIETYSGAILNTIYELDSLEAGTYIFRFLVGGEVCYNTIADPAFFIVVGNTSFELDPVNITPPKCLADPLGKIELSASGGFPPYEYEWNNGLTGGLITGLGPDIYNVSVTDMQGCLLTLSNIVTDALALKVDISVTDVRCNGGIDGIAVANASIGATPYSYLWSDGSTASLVSGLDTELVSVTVTDNNGCSVIGTEMISEPGLVSLEIVDTNSIACYGVASGSCLVSATGGNGAPYSYKWFKGLDFINVIDTDSLLGNMEGGVKYSVQVSDALGCLQILSCRLTEPAELLNSSTKKDITCNGDNDGEASVIASGGTSGYSYLWSNSEIASSILNLSEGTYNVTITDDNECKLIETFLINNPDALQIGSVDITNISCTDFNDGMATANVIGGVSAYTYFWSNSLTTQTISDLSEGEYSVTVTDANACLALGTTKIINPEPMVIDSIVVMDVSCSNALDGAVIVFANGGTNSYTYLWNTGLTTQDVSNIAGGVYSVTVSDFKNCTVSSTANVGELSEVLISGYTATDITCNGAGDGKASVTVVGGASNYTYYWMPMMAVTQEITNLSEGLYSVTVSDDNNCNVVKTLFITNPEELTVDTINIGQITCYGYSDGSAWVSYSGGTDAVSYSWNSGPTTPFIQNLNEFDYVVTVTDANDCQSVATISIVDPMVLVIDNISTVHLDCFGYDNGEATVSASGGTGAYTYFWGPSPTSTAITIEDLVAGDYHVTVTDNENCTVTGQTTISQPELISFSIDTSNHNGNAYAVSCHGGADGEINIIDVQGGVGGYTFSLDDPPFDSNPNYLMPAGTYNVKVKDNNDCIITQEITINQPPELQILNFQAVESIVCEGTEAEITFSESGGIPAYHYEWYLNDEGGEEDFSSISLVDTGGLYSLVLIDSNLCTTAAELTITAVPKPILSIANDPSLNFNDTIVLTESHSSDLIFELTNEAAATIQWAADSIYWDYFTDNGITTTGNIGNGQEWGISGALNGIYSTAIVSYSLVPVLDSEPQCVGNENKIWVHIIPDNPGSKPGDSPQFFIPNVITPNGDGFNEDFRIVYEDINIQAADYIIQIFNRNGDKVDELNGLNTVWRATGYPAGAYFVKIIKGNNEIYAGGLTVVK